MRECYRNQTESLKNTWKFFILLIPKLLVAKSPMNRAWQKEKYFNTHAMIIFVMRAASDN